MNTVPNGSPVDEARAPADSAVLSPDLTPDLAPAPAFHVELTPVAAAPLFHALHGTVPAAAVPHLPSHLEEVLLHPLPKR